MKNSLTLLLFLSVLQSVDGFAQDVVYDFTRVDSLVFQKEFDNSHQISAYQKNPLSKVQLVYDDSLILEAPSIDFDLLQVNSNNDYFFFVGRDNSAILVNRLNLLSARIDTILAISDADLIGIIDDRLIGIQRADEDRIDIRSNATGVSGGVKGQNQLRRKVVSYDLQNFKKEIILELDAAILKYSEDIFSVFIFPGTKKLLIQTGVYESGDYALEQRLVFDIDSKSVNSVGLPSFVTESGDPKYRWGEARNVVSYDSQMRALFTDRFIINQDYVIEGFCLTKSSYRLMEYFTVDEMPYVPSVIDEKNGNKQVRGIVPFNETIELETALFKVYSDSILLQRDLEKLSESDLGILKNLVFAKHNYRFQSLYYQAIFNLFEFYNSELKRKRRTIDVNALLSDIDKKNLNTLQVELKGRGK
ncbi:MAG: YARHG domain-containing protein [Imperialibacter sp.]|uniref:YARHG domain-containing protein n=1 Tax=Imperialibacter sp. TaxID=2038411 RepID=UPI0032EFFB80